MSTNTTQEAHVDDLKIQVRFAMFQNAIKKCMKRAGMIGALFFKWGWLVRVVVAERCPLLLYLKRELLSVRRGRRKVV